jgi:hypothetical protein
VQTGRSAHRSGAGPPDVPGRALQQRACLRDQGRNAEDLPGCESSRLIAISSRQGRDQLVALRRCTPGGLPVASGKALTLALTGPRG